MKIEEMEDVFLNLANFVPHAIFDFSATYRLCFEPKSIDQGVKN